MQSSLLQDGAFLADDEHELGQMRASFGHMVDDHFARSSLSVTGGDQTQTLHLSKSSRQDLVDVPSGDALRKFWLRALTCTIVPTSIAVFYACIWMFWLRSSDNESPLIHGRKGGRWVFYGWFVVGAFGINLSKYGLAGAEAAMLMDTRWGAKNAMQLLMHCDKTWASPIGWINIITDRSRGRQQQPTLTWLLLASISMIPFIALPLSGFTMELTSGYADGVPGIEKAPLTGQNETNFPDQYNQEALVRAFNHWKYRLPSQLSGRSAFYVPEASSKTGRGWLKSFPNSWPDDDNMTVFLAPQSDNPVHGEAWGLQAAVNCTTVSSIQQFQLLSQRSVDGSQPRCPAIRVGVDGYDYPEYAMLPQDSCDFDVYLQTPSTNLSTLAMQDVGFFVDGFLEIAVKYERRTNLDGGTTAFNDPYPLSIEAALWQAPINLSQSTQLCPGRALVDLVSNGLNVTVTGMQKTYIPGPSFYDGTSSGGSNFKPVTINPVGVRCTSSLIAGTATLDGLRGTFASFAPRDPVPLPSATLVPLETAVPKILRGELSAALTMQETIGFQGLEGIVNNNKLLLDSPDGVDPLPEIAANASWLANTYRSVDAYDVIHPCGDGNVAEQQLRLITSEQFKQSIIRAHKAYAIELLKSSSGQWYGNLTYAEATSILAPGSISPLSVMILLMVWAFCSSAIGIVFGCRPRWAETLDGFAMFRFGSDFAGFADGVCVKPYRECPELTNIPGLVGDSRPGERPGHITLVDKTAARWDKRYAGSTRQGRSFCRVGRCKES